MKAIFPEVFLFYVRVINKMKLMCCTFILKNVINCTDESRTASSINRYTRNKYIFHTQPNTFFSNIYNTIGDKICIAFCIKSVTLPHRMSFECHLNVPIRMSLVTKPFRMISGAIRKGVKTILKIVHLIRRQVLSKNQRVLSNREKL